MTVVEWLRRLNLDKYAAHFTKEKMFFVTDLRLYRDEGSAGRVFKMKNKVHAKRYANMLSGDALSKQLFKLLTVN